MVSWVSNKRCGPIGLDVGTRSVKLVQFSADHSQLLDAVRWEFPDHKGADGTAKDDSAQDDRQRIAASLRQAMEGRRFRGRQVVVCLNQQQLFLQNLRVPAQHSVDLQKLVQQEAAARLPFSISEAEIRFVEAASVQQGDHVMREVILFASHRPQIDAFLQIVEAAGLRPVAVDVEPAALLRAYLAQFRREDDSHRRTLYVHIGYGKTSVIVAEGDKVLFIKYVDVGGQHMDQAVAQHLQMELREAIRLRRHNGDRRSAQQDPEIAMGVAEAIRPTVDKLAVEMSRCIRYHSVTFRGKPLERAVLGGGEASRALAEKLSASLEITCLLSDPLRKFVTAENVGRRGQWDVAMGLALRNLE